ncbi:putative periplasmic lipoprotein [Alkaliphilus peptidifermentans]|uniref:YD repeat-containing protein n=1 Tax=Alkaliphilus peptidifermentans DSM 18978 TaxID=1120976 RepID=A0A1G5GXR9_9FIRM|nr:hypothetical protein [Alkaliphilus peptidifermentans]SCY55940.1 YD repeat-containing protein [Alkaliphilus peptidifermentans DSM 18978]
MRKKLLAFIILFVLSGCSQKIITNNEESILNNEISTYKEVIKDGKVEIDGISYDIISVTKTTYKYDDNGNVLERFTTSDGSETRIEYLYENNLLIEDRMYSNYELSLTSYYYYEDDLLIKKRTVSKGGLEAVTEYSYENKTETQTSYSSSGSISYISTAYLDDDDKILKVITEEGEIMTSSTFHYDNDLLIKVIVERNGIKIKTFSYEYNNVGDKTIEYNIWHGEVNTLFAAFFDYEYDENLLPKTVIMYRIQSPIEEENILQIFLQ